MKVLQFAFDPREAGDYNPAHYPYNSVCFTGTHDNTTLRGWIDDEANAPYVENAIKALGVGASGSADVSGALVFHSFFPKKTTTNHFFRESFPKNSKKRRFLGKIPKIKLAFTPFACQL